MTKMYEKLKIDSLATRRAKDTLSSRLLTTLLSEVNMRAKNDGNRSPNDTDVEKTVEKFIKSVNDTKQFLVTAGKATIKEDQELEILQNYVLQKMSDDDTKTAVESAKAEVGDNIGAIMKYLKENYGSQIDMKKAKEFI